MNVEKSSINIALSIHNWSKNLLSDWGISPAYINYVNLLILSIYTIVLLIILDFLISKIFVKTILTFIRRSPTKFDDYLIDNKTFVYTSRLILLYVGGNLVNTVFIDFQSWINFTRTLLDVIIVFHWYFLFRSVLRSIKDHLLTKHAFRDKPVSSYLQVANIVLVFILAIILFTMLTGQDVWKFLGAFGAASAIVMLVFKDTILGFVASIQVSVNDMVRIGDWIEMPKYGADGDVLEINLNTVKIQNWDKTITTIPTHYLVTDSFKNWRGMQNIGGRRIKRPLHIKMSSIRYLEKYEIENLKKIQILAPYIEERQQEIDRYNVDKGADRSMPINGRNMTNIGLFREYINRYVRNNSNIRQDMTLLVRHLAPTEHGLPLELYMFTADTRWAYYENIMADIFDHLFAAIKFFDLEIFEAPASDDIRKLNLPIVDEKEDSN